MGGITRTELIGESAPDAFGALEPVTIPPEATDAALLAAPSRHLGFPGGWEKSVTRADVIRMLEAAASWIVNAERSRAQDGVERDQDRITALENALHAVDPHHSLLNDGAS